MINVKVAVMPGALKEYVLEDGASVGQALAVAGESTDGFTVTVNGAAATSETVLSDGSNVILSKAAKGNA